MAPEIFWGAKNPPKALNTPHFPRFSISPKKSQEPHISKFFCGTKSHKYSYMTTEWTKSDWSNERKGKQLVRIAQLFPNLTTLKIAFDMILKKNAYVWHNIEHISRGYSRIYGVLLSSKFEYPYRFSDANFGYIDEFLNEWEKMPESERTTLTIAELL